MDIGIIIAAVLISLAIGIVIGIAYRKKVAESKIQGAENEAKRLIDSAKKEFVINIGKEIRKLKKNKAIIKKSLIVWTVILGIMSVLITAFIIYMIIIIIGITSGAIRLM